MMKNKNIQDFIELSNRNLKSLPEIGLKLAEETGEVSEALLKYLGASGMGYKTEDKDNLRANLLEELLDNMMIAGSMFILLGGTEDEFNTLLAEKNAKWKATTK